MSPESVTHVQVRGQTYGYLPGRRALPFGRYSLPVPLRVGDRVGLNGRLNTKMVYSRTVTSANEYKDLLQSLTFRVRPYVVIATKSVHRFQVRPIVHN